MTLCRSHRVFAAVLLCGLAAVSLGLAPWADWPSNDSGWSDDNRASGGPPGQPGSAGPDRPTIRSPRSNLVIDWSSDTYDLVITGKPAPRKEAEAARAVIERELDRYPPGFITSDTSGRGVVAGVFIYRTLTVNGVPAGGTYVAPGIVYLAVGTRAARGRIWEESIIRTLHHEISSQLLFRYRTLFDEEAFRALLPDGFVYEDERPGAEISDIRFDRNRVGSLQDLADGFLTEFASRNLEQDLNTYAEILMWRPELLDQFDARSRVARKAAIVRAFYISIDGEFEAVLEGSGADD